MRNRIVIAIGGNSLIRNGQSSIEQQYACLAETCKHMAALVAKGYQVVVTHGNGPQVGHVLLRNELSAASLPPDPLDVCVAATEGTIGYLLQRSMVAACKKLSVERQVVTVITQVLVDRDDSAFYHPTKPIGLWYDREKAAWCSRTYGWRMVEDAGRGFRRVVPSPRPVGLMEASVIRRLVDQETIVIAAGGGGIPVAQQGDELVGVSAVVDKDLTAALLAKLIDADCLLISTAVDSVYLNFNTNNRKALHTVNLSEAERYLEEGQFPPGSMGPKIEAIISFLRNGGRTGIITSPDKMLVAMDGQAGTHFVIRAVCEPTM